MEKAKVLRFVLIAAIVSLGIVRVIVAQTAEVKIIPIHFIPMVEAGKPYTVSWIIEAEAKITHTDIHWRFIQDPAKLFEKLKKEERKIFFEDKDYLDEQSFNKGKEFKEKVEIFNDDTLVIPEPSGDEAPIIEMVIHAVVDGKNYYAPQILHIMPAGSMPPGSGIPWGEYYGDMRLEETHNPWDYSLPVWFDTENASPLLWKWSDGSWAWTGPRDQRQYWNTLSGYRPPGDAWENEKFGHRVRGSYVDWVTGEWTSPLSRWYYYSNGMPPFFTVRERDGTWRTENLYEPGWWMEQLVPQGREYFKAIFGFQIPADEPFTDLNGNGKWDSGEPYDDLNGNGEWDQGVQGRIPNIVFVDVSSAYSDNINDYRLNNTPPDMDRAKDLGSFLTGGGGKLVFDLGGYLSPGGELPVELTIAGPLKNYTSPPGGLIQERWKYTWDYNYKNIQFSTPRLAKVDLSVADIKVIQVNEGLPLVAKKDTIVRVDVNLSGDLDEIELEVNLEIKDSNGNVVYSSDQHANEPKVKKTYPGIDPSDNKCHDDERTVHKVNNNAFIFKIGTLPAGEYELKAIVDSDQKVIETNEANNEFPRPSDAPFKVKMNNTHGLQLTYVPIPVAGQLPNLGPRGPQEDFLVATYPLSKYLFSSIPLSPLSQDGERRSWLKLIRWVHEKCALYYHNMYDSRTFRFVGVVPPNYGLDGIHWKLWYPSTVLIDITNETVLAHEVGHSYGLWPLGLLFEEYRIYPRRGKSAYNTPTFRNITTYRSYENKWEYILFPYAEWQDQPLGFSKICFMGAPTEYDEAWIDQECYSNPFPFPGLYQRFREGALPDPRLLLIRGTIYKNDRVVLDPSYDLGMGVGDTVPPGNYSIQCLSGSGELLSEFSFNLDFESEPLRTMGEFPFSFVIEHPIGTERIVIKHGETILKEVYESFNVPIITITSQELKEDGTLELSWVATDPDGDTLSYGVYYSHDNGSTWLPIGYDLEVTHYSLDTTPLPGGFNCLTKVVATDNFNRAEAVSNPFYLPNKPPTVYINIPLEGSAFIQGSRLRLSGWAYDPEDGDLRNSSLIWTSSLDGEIGTGSPLSYRNLSLGDHLITLTTVDSEGNIAIAETSISVTTETAPDLSVHSIEFSPEKPKAINEEIEEVTITANIFNIRSDASCEVSFQANEVSFANKYIVASANELTSVHAKWIPPERGTYDISIVISNSSPEESDLTNNEASRLLQIEEDLTPPTTTDDYQFNGIWTNQDANITLTATDDVSGVAHTYYLLDGVQYEGTTITITEEGEHTVEYWSVDNADNAESLHTIGVWIDKTPPCTIHDYNYDGVWVNTDANITLTATDELSRVNKTYFTIDDGPENIGTSISITTEGSHLVKYWSVDIVGNIESVHEISVKIDRTPPVTTATVTPTPNEAGWHNTLPVSVTFSAIDNLSGVESTTPDIEITEEGIHEIKYFSTDNAGNVEEEKIITVSIDTTPAEVVITAEPSVLWPPDHKPVQVTINGSATDALSGVLSKVFTVTDEYNGVEADLSDFGQIIELISWRNGEDKDGRIYTIKVVVTDKADNFATKETTVTVPHDMRNKEKGKKK